MLDIPSEGLLSLSEGMQTRMSKYCTQCGNVAGTLYLDGEAWVCRHCLSDVPGDAPYFKEMGVENPRDPEGSTAHVRDIKARRWDPKEERLFYYTPPKTYFFLKG